jgi:carboxypeptidase family protein
VSAVLALGLGVLTTAAIAQQPAPTARTDFVTGRVVDDSARAIAGAEVLILVLDLRALTGADGQFRLDRVPVGSWTLVVRAIRFLPDTQVVRVTALGASLGAVVLHSSPVILPELEATGKLPSPAFGLAFGTTIDAARYCGGCDLSERFLPSGASMTEGGRYLVLARARWRDTVPVIHFYEWQSGVGEPRSGTGIVCINNRGRPVATRIEDHATARVLFSDGTVWFNRLGTVDCLRSVLLFLGHTARAAVSLDSSWVIVLEDRARSATLVNLSDHGQLLWTLPLETVFATDKPRRDVILAPARGGATVALTETPYTWALVDSTGSVALRSFPIAGDRTDSLLRRAAAERWKAYAVLPVKDGFVQTLESPGLRMGLFVLYDVLGRPVRVMPRVGPSVLIASAPDLRMLLGYRYRNPWGGKSVLYMYRY